MSIYNLRFFLAIVTMLFVFGCTQDESKLESVDLTTLKPAESDLPSDFSQYMQKYFISNDNSTNELFVGYKKDLLLSKDSDTFYDLGIWIIEFDDVKDSAAQMNIQKEDIDLSDDVERIENNRLDEIDTRTFIYTHTNVLDSENQIPSKSVIVGSRKNNYFFTVTATALIHEDEDYVLDKANHYLQIVYEKLSELDESQT